MTTLMGIMRQIRESLREARLLDVEGQLRSTLNFTASNPRSFTMATFSNHRSDDELWQIIRDPTIWPGLWAVIAFASQSPNIQIQAEVSLKKVLREAHKVASSAAPNIHGAMTGDAIDILGDQVRRLWKRLGLV
jgi:hypothetical protein